MLGLIASLTVTVKTQVGVPQSFDAEIVTVVFPLLKVAPLPVPLPLPLVAPVKV